MKIIFKILFPLMLVFYLVAYVAFRTVNAEVWDKNGQTYVIFPADNLRA